MDLSRCPFIQKKRIEVRPGAKLHGRLSKNAYSNSDSSYEYICENPPNNILAYNKI